MADKEKRLRKILLKHKYKGILKPVKTLEEAHIIIVEDPHTRKKAQFFNKEMYQLAIDRGVTFPEHQVHFLVPSNPRNIRQVIESIVTNGLLGSVL